MRKEKYDFMSLLKNVNLNFNLTFKAWYSTNMKFFLNIFFLNDCDESILIIIIRARVYLIKIVKYVFIHQNIQKYV